MFVRDMNPNEKNPDNRKDGLTILINGEEKEYDEVW
jgi:hypothetical protein